MDFSPLPGTFPPKDRAFSTDPRCRAGAAAGVRAPDCGKGLPPLTGRSAAGCSDRHPRPEAGKPPPAVILSGGPLGPAKWGPL